jgi:hypothetical protein
MNSRVMVISRVGEQEQEQEQAHFGAGFWQEQSGVKVFVRT